MKYTIDQLTPLEGISKSDAYENGEYDLMQESSFDDLLQALDHLRYLIKTYGNESDFELRIHHSDDYSEPYLITLDNVLMFD